jgi:hypothetical protein
LQLWGVTTSRGPPDEAHVFIQKSNGMLIRKNRFSGKKNQEGEGVAKDAIYTAKGGEGIEFTSLKVFRQGRYNGSKMELRNVRKVSYGQIVL